MWFLEERKNFLKFFLCVLNHDFKGFNLIYHSAQSDDSLCYLILRGKQNEKTKTYPNTKFLPILKVGTINILFNIEYHPIFYRIFPKDNC